MFGEETYCHWRWSSVPGVIIVEITHDRFSSPAHTMYIRLNIDEMQVLDCHTHPSGKRCGYFRKACIFAVGLYPEVKWLTTQKGTRSGNAAMKKIGFKSYSRGLRVSRARLES